MLVISVRVAASSNPGNWRCRSGASWVKVSQPAGEQLRRLLCLGSRLGATGVGQCNNRRREAHQTAAGAIVETQHWRNVRTA